MINTIEEKDVKRYIRGLQDLSTIPLMLGRIINVCNDERSSPDDLYELITVDPALAERVLRMANSVMLGHSGQINDIQQAIMFLGFERIKSVALGMTVISMFPAGDTSTVDNLWIHGYEVAFLASTLTGYVPMTNPGECFFAGLLHDIGRTLFFMMDSDRFLGIAAWDDMAEQETAAFGCTHSQAGAWLAESLGIPARLSAPIRDHHVAAASPDPQKIIPIVALAEAFSRRFSPRIEDDGIWTPEHDVLLMRLSLSEDDMNEIGDKLIAARPEIERTFSSR